MDQRRQRIAHNQTTWRRGDPITCENGDNLPDGFALPKVRCGFRALACQFNSFLVRQWLQPSRSCIPDVGPCQRGDLAPKLFRVNQTLKLKRFLLVPVFWDMWGKRANDTAA
jgi:hypothetical protein